jgi:hypothetical protein
MLRKLKFESEPLSFSAIDIFDKPFEACGSMEIKEWSI